MTDEEIREYARAGALEHALKIVTEFPWILAELNRMASRQPAAAAEPDDPRHPHSVAPVALRKKRLTDAGRQAIAEAQHRRWARHNGGSRPKASR